MSGQKDSTAAAEFPEAQSENAVSDLLLRAIKRHDAAQTYFASTCYLSDSAILGMGPTGDEEAIYRTASDIEKAALSDVCYFPVSSPEDCAAKARHLRKYHSDYFGNLEEWQVENLLRSMLPKEERDLLHNSAPEADGEPIFEPAKLSMEGLFVLHDGLKVISSVIAGLACQPRFAGDHNVKVPPHGDMLQRFAEFIDEVMEAIYNEALARAPVTDHERDHKFGIVADRYLDGSGSPEYIMAELAKEVTKIGGVA